jgi:hypothetical protein
MGLFYLNLTVSWWGSRGDLLSNKELAIEQVELKSLYRDDGITDRSMWKKSVVLESDIYESFQNTAKELHMRA